MRVWVGVFLIILSAVAFVAAAKQIEMPAFINGSAQDRPSPYPRIGRDRIHLFPDRIVIDLVDAHWATFTDSNSMDPLFDEGHFAIQVTPKTEQDIHVGDIISYSVAGTDGIIVHRVVAIGDDGEWYAIVRGDNNSLPDPGKVRFGQIKRVMAAIIY
ncbi:signal peptidase I [Candidatus Woesearchaeota archaeon]|nr:signal peptidase I [Candidatus Woesearchaeota archaeon]